MDLGAQSKQKLIARLYRSSSARYWVTIALVALATVLRWLFNGIFGTNFEFVFYYPAIMAIAWIGGIGPTLLGVVLSVSAADFFFIAPRYSFVISHSQDRLLTGLFSFVGIAAGFISEGYRAALRSTKDAYEVIARHQAELQQIYASTPIGLGFLDENLRYIRVNDALAAFNGVPADQHPGRHIWEILSRETAEMITPMLMRVMQTGQPLINLELLGRRAPGSEELRHVRASFYPAQIGNVRGVHGVVEDITAEKNSQEALKKAEEQLRYASKMEAVGRLAGGIAHDFNNLLMVISSYTELLEHQLSNPEHLKKLRAISGAAQRAARLTQQLLAFGRKQPMQVQVFEFEPWMRSFEQVLRSALRDNIELRLDLNTEGINLKADPSLFEQALMSLAMNARDAMAAGGRLTIRTDVRNIQAPETHASFDIAPGQYIELALSDSGPGISAEVQARIFDPFFTTKEHEQGSGLGMAMVYGIVKQSGGYIAVESSEGKGTTFRLWLPVTEEAFIATPPALESAKNRSGMILLAEDESTLREAICETLIALGYRVKEAHDGAEALHLFQQHAEEIDLLITDAVMPNLGGVELIDRLRSLHSSVKAILMSGYANSVSSQTLPAQLSAGLIFLQKPFAQDELAKAVRRALSSNLN